MPVIAVDVMSGERGALECIRGAVLAIAADPDLQLLLVGDANLIA
ncbi:MAG: phosphate--acyl-ACP acyltransferase, partial [Gammaproteobacteria bacterium]|nr:phosphate--acyl-ACP acyltransferase [Gammaproteobacteria bacterium]